MTAVFFRVQNRFPPRGVTWGIYNRDSQIILETILIIICLVFMTYLCYRFAKAIHYQLLFIIIHDPT